jgi:hypothetical protein
MRYFPLIVLAGCAAKAPSNHQLTPSTSQVRYRFDSRVENDPRRDIEDAIRAGEARERPDPLEMTELANLYLARASLDGDRKDFAASEHLAHESLKLLPAPNGAMITLAKLANARHRVSRARRSHARLGRRPPRGAVQAAAVDRSRPRARL